MNSRLTAGFIVYRPLYIISKKFSTVRASFLPMSGLYNGDRFVRRVFADEKKEQTNEKFKTICPNSGRSCLGEVPVKMN